MKRLHCVAICGAPSTGKSWLANALTDVLRMRGHTVTRLDALVRHEGDQLTPPSRERTGPAPAHAMDDSTQAWGISITLPITTALHPHVRLDAQSLRALPPPARFDSTLLTGLDWPGEADGPHLRGPVDSLIRQALSEAGMAYQVVYGQGQQRLNNALLALGLPGEDPEARALREQAQFAINQGRTLWQCQDCSDPACEHTLFTRLLAHRSTRAGPSAV